ncbi:helix-turn-helix domain-containing protein [Streptomyces sp. NPDC056672]|uniref:helix-turn-helix domain-containing protein n=1 Tax=Streptomyces sp. NPDC056672 TaxID=3345906 RepID=UPI0036B8B7F1
MSEQPHQIGQRIATRRRARRLTQTQLAAAAYLSVATIRAIERGARRPSDMALETIAAALGVDPSALLEGHVGTERRVRAALPEISSSIAGYDIPPDSPMPPLGQLATAVTGAESWRLAAQYGRVAQSAPTLLTGALAAFHAADGRERRYAARLLASAARTADAAAYKYGAHDLSARLIDLMRWASAQADDPLLEASASYVRTETFFAAGAHRTGLKALELAVDQGPVATTPQSIAALGALHMRAAVVAGRLGDSDAADVHLDEARSLGDQVPEGIYVGTAFGPESVRIHEVSVAVSLGGDHVGRAFDVVHEWTPPKDLPAERRSGFWIELARAQLWGNRREDAHESLKVARRIAPLHTREHPWARETVATLRRLRRADDESLTSLAEWIGAI